MSVAGKEKPLIATSESQVDNRSSDCDKSSSRLCTPQCIEYRDRPPPGTWQQYRNITARRQQVYWEWETCTV